MSSDPVRRLASTLEEGVYEGTVLRGIDASIPSLECDGRRHACPVHLLSRPLVPGEYVRIEFHRGRGMVTPVEAPRQQPPPSVGDLPWARLNEVYEGPIVEVLADPSVPPRARAIVQRLGTGGVIVHDERDLDQLPELGTVVRIRYRGGQGRVDVVG